MGFSPCGENLRYHNPVLTNDSASITFRRISLTSARISRMDERQNRMLAPPPRLRWVNSASFPTPPEAPQDPSDKRRADSVERPDLSAARQNGKKDSLRRKVVRLGAE
jgi:hypothetical protein